MKAEILWFRNSILWQTYGKPVWCERWQLRPKNGFLTHWPDAKLSTLNRIGQDTLYRMSLLKGFLSSLAACLQTFNVRIRTLSKRYEKLTGSPFPNGDGADQTEKAEKDLLLAKDEEREIPVEAKQNMSRQRELAEGIAKTFHSYTN